MYHPRMTFAWHWTSWSLSIPVVASGPHSALLVGSCGGTEGLSSATTPLLTAYPEPRVALEANEWHGSRSAGAHKVPGPAREPPISPTHLWVCLMKEGAPIPGIWYGNQTCAQSKLPLSRKCEEKLEDKFYSWLLICENFLELWEKHQSFCFECVLHKYVHE